VQPPEAMPWGQTTAYVTDPNGFLVEICTPVAHAHGYADQAHMSRDLGRWFGLTPTALRRDPARVARLADPGCD